MHAGRATLPGILYGTAWKKGDTARLVEQALNAGFRGLDTACQPKHYNEPGVGEGIAAFLRNSGVSRSDLYIQTKFTSLDGQDPQRVPYDSSHKLYDQVLESCAVSRRNLGVETLDCLLLHSPLRTQEQTFVAWSAFEHLVEAGAVRTLGLSNCYKLSLFRAIWQRAKTKPVVIQNRFYADTGFDVELRKFCAREGVTYQSFWTLTANPALLKHSVVRTVAERLCFTPEQTVLRCLTQMGIVPLVGTTKTTHMMQDLATFEKRLLDTEVEAINDLLR